MAAAASLIGPRSGNAYCHPGHDFYSAGQIGSFNATPIFESWNLPRERAFSLPGGIYMHPIDQAKLSLRFYILDRINEIRDRLGLARVSL